MSLIQVYRSRKRSKNSMEAALSKKMRSSCRKPFKSMNNSKSCTSKS